MEMIPWLDGNLISGDVDSMIVTPTFLFPTSQFKLTKHLIYKASNREEA